MIPRIFLRLPWCVRTRYHPTQRDACSDLQPFWLEGLFGSGQPPLLCEKAKTTRDLPGCRTDTASTPDHKRPCSTDIASIPGFLETLRFYATHGFYFTQGLYDTPAFMIPRIFLCLLWCLRTRSKDATYTTATSDGPRTPRKGPRCHHDATRRLKMLLRADAAAHRRADDVPRHRPSVRPPAAHGKGGEHSC